MVLAQQAKCVCLREKSAQTTGISACRLLKSTKITASVASPHQNLRHQPVSGGVRVTRAAVAREPSPALLRGLIFTGTGVAMTPHHIKKGTRHYRHYVSMDVVRKRPKAELRGPKRLPGRVVEDAVIGEI